MPIANRSRRSSLIRNLLKSDLSYSLPLLFTKELLWVILSGHSWATGAICSFHERIALSLIKNKQIARKTDEWIPNHDLLEPREEGGVGDRLRLQKCLDTILRQWPAIVSCFADF